MSSSSCQHTHTHTHTRTHTHTHTHTHTTGDGATDLEARDTHDGAGGADLFVGYGGSNERKGVREAADLYIHDFQQLIQLVN